MIYTVLFVDKLLYEQESDRALTLKKATLEKNAGLIVHTR